MAVWIAYERRDCSECFAEIGRASAFCKCHRQILAGRASRHGRRDDLGRRHTHAPDRCRHLNLGGLLWGVWRP